VSFTEIPCGPFCGGCKLNDCAPRAVRQDRPTAGFSWHFSVTELRILSRVHGRVPPRRIPRAATIAMFAGFGTEFPLIRSWPLAGRRLCDLHLSKRRHFYGPRSAPMTAPRCHRRCATQRASVGTISAGICLTVTARPSSAGSPDYMLDSYQGTQAFGNCILNWTTQPPLL